MLVVVHKERNGYCAEEPALSPIGHRNRFISELRLQHFNNAEATFQTHLRESADRCHEPQRIFYGYFKP